MEYKNRTMMLNFHSFEALCEIEIEIIPLFANFLFGKKVS